MNASKNPDFIVGNIPNGLIGFTLLPPTGEISFRLSTKKALIKVMFKQWREADRAKILLRTDNHEPEEFQ